MTFTYGFQKKLVEASAQLTFFYPVFQVNVIDNSKGERTS